jgi:hypothetical protein
LAESFRHEFNVHGNERAGVLADTLDAATGKFLEENKSPSRKVGEIDNRGSHFYLTLYWAQQPGRKGSRREAGRHRERTPRGSGQPRRPRRLLLPERREDDCGHASVVHAQRDHLLTEQDRLNRRRQPDPLIGLM